MSAASIDKLLSTPSPITFSSERPVVKKPVAAPAKMEDCLSIGSLAAQLQRVIHHNVSSIVSAQPVSALDLAAKAAIGGHRS